MRNIINFFSFNESVSSKEELEAFCESYLSYLIDIGFTIRIVDGGRVMSGKQIFLLSIRAPKLFAFSEIKDDFMQFFNMLDCSYIIRKDKKDYCIHVEFIEDGYWYKTFTIDGLLDVTDMYLLSIKIEVII